MSILLIAEHNNSNLKVFTLNAITAASKIDRDINVLVAGNKCEYVAKEVSAIPLVKKVLHSESLIYEHFLAENLTPLIIKLSGSYTHIVASANTFGKNLMPRVAALLDCSQISDVIKINSPEEFLRPIYAGNAFATIKSNDKKKCVTIRPTSFDPAPTSGGSAQIEKIEAMDIPNISKFIKNTLFV
jgi:electron transfer flavoprotein alpha subunit